MQLENYLKKCLDYENEEIMDIILSIVVNVPLKELYNEIISNIDNINSEKVNKYITKVIEEVKSLEKIGKL